MGQVRVVVVGGGIAGLVAARDIALARPDADVTVLEAADRVGGKLRLAEVAGHQVDVGAESILVRRPEGRALVRDLGLDDRVVHPEEVGALVWSRGELHPLPGGTVMGIPADPAGAEGLLTPSEVSRAAAEPDRADAVTRDVSVGEYVSERVGVAVVDRLVEPLLGGVYAGHARRLSLHATLPQVWEVASAGERLLDGVGRLAAVAQDSAAGPVFAGLRGGVGILPEALAVDLADRGVTVCTATIARELRRRPTGWAVVSGPTRAPDVHPADAVVLASPARPTSRLLFPHSERAARLLGSVPYASMAIVTLAVDPAVVARLPASGFLVPPVDGRTVKASTFSSRKWRWLAEEAPEVGFLRASIGRAGEEADLQRDDADLVAVAVAEVEEAVGRSLGHLADAHVQRWGGALPQYDVGHVDLVADVRDAVAGLPGVALAGAAYEGVGIPAVAAGAHAAAAQVLTHLGQRRAAAGE
jgi:oxygen-dependent protoporphyrinogen oxidase